MVSDARSQYCDTSNPYIKYQIIVSEDAVLEASNKSILNITVEAWRTNTGYPTDRAGTCWVKIDGSDRLGAQGWESGEKTIDYMSDTEVYHVGLDPNVDPDDPTQPYVIHDSDGSKTVYIEAAITWWAGGEPYYDSDYQGFYVELTKINRGPAFEVTISPINITHNSAELLVSSTRNSCVQWWYAVGDENGENFGDWVEFSTGLGTSASFLLTDLEPNTKFSVKAKAKRLFAADTAESTVYIFKTQIQPISNAVVRRITLFEDGTTDFSTNGIGSLLDAFSCVITEELNGQYELVMEYPVSGRLFQYLEFRRIIMANPNQYSGPQPFRIYSISKPLNGRVTVNAAHISYDLSGYTVAPFTASSLATVFGQISAKVDTECPFSFWTDMISDEGISTTIPCSIRSVLGDDAGTILGTYGGEYEFDMFNVKLWAQRGVNRGVTLRYGKNLTSFKQDANNNNVYTAIRPFWYREPQEENPEEGGLVELPEKIISVGSYSYTRIIVVDLTDQFVDEEGKEFKPTVEQLRAMANWFIENNDIGIPEVSLSVSFVQLSDSLEYKDIALLERVQLGDTVNVLFPELRVSAEAKCIKTVFNVLSQRYNSLDLGSAKATLSGTISNSMKSSKDWVTKEELKNSLVYVKDTDTTVKNYVYLDYTTKPARLISMDTAKSDNAKNVWKVDIDGLSHSSNGVRGPYKSALNQAGAIDSSFLKLGQLDGNINKQGTIAIDTIHSEYGKKVDNKVDDAMVKTREELKLADTRTNNLSKLMYTNELVVGKGKFVKVTGGIDFILYEEDEE